MGAFSGEDIISKCIINEFRIKLKYEKFSEIAKQEGFPNIARLLKALVMAEEIHLQMFLRLHKNKQEITQQLNGLKNEMEIKVESTAKNLTNCINEEKLVGNELYEKLAKAALKDNPGLFIMIKQAADASKYHEKILRKALEHVNKGEDLEIKNGIYICPTCGLVIINEPPFRCPICNENKRNFIKV